MKCRDTVTQDVDWCAHAGRADLDNLRKTRKLAGLPCTMGAVKRSLCAYAVLTEKEMCAMQKELAEMATAA